MEVLVWDLTTSWWKYPHISTGSTRPRATALLPTLGLLSRALVSQATLGVPTALLLLPAACGFPSRSPASRLSASYRNRHLGAAGRPALTFPAQDEPTCPFVVALRNIIGSGNILSVLCTNVSVLSNGLLQQKLEKTIHISVLWKTHSGYLRSEIPGSPSTDKQTMPFLFKNKFYKKKQNKINKKKNTHEFMLSACAASALRH